MCYNDTIVVIQIPVEGAVPMFFSYKRNLNWLVALMGVPGVMIHNIMAHNPSVVTDIIIIGLFFLASVIITVIKCYSPRLPKSQYWGFGVMVIGAIITLPFLPSDTDTSIRSLYICAGVIGSILALGIGINWCQYPKEYGEAIRKGISWQ